MQSPTGIIPEELMFPQKLREVVVFLQAQVLPGRLKLELLQGWALTVGIRLRQRDLRAVERTGFDVQPGELR